MDPVVDRLSHLHSISALVSTAASSGNNQLGTFYGQVLHGVAGDAVELAEPVERRYCMQCRSFLVAGKNCRFSLVPLNRSIGGYKRALKRHILSSFVFDGPNAAETRVFGMKQIQRKRDKNLLAYHCLQCQCITVRPGFGRHSFHAVTTTDKANKLQPPLKSTNEAKKQKSEEPSISNSRQEKKKPLNKKSQSLKKMIKQAQQSKPSTSSADFSLEDFFS